MQTPDPIDNELQKVMTETGIKILAERTNAGDDLALNFLEKALAFLEAPPERLEEAVADMESALEKREAARDQQSGRR